jgi:hypothetical protein
MEIVEGEESRTFNLRYRKYELIRLRAKVNNFLAKMKGVST